jgi:hypothetical protein
MSSPSKAAISSSAASSVEVAELVDAARGEEGLEAEDACVVQLPQRPQVLRHGTAPEADVHQRLGRRHLALGGESVDGGGGRDAVQRHVDDGRHAPGGGRAGGAGEALPLGASRFVHVHVRVDDSGDQHLVVGEHHDRGALQRCRADGGDHAVGDPDVGGPPVAPEEDEVGADDEVEGFRHAFTVAG